jgi:imidazolonepropionase
MDAMAIAREAAMFCDRIWLNAHVATLRSDRPGIGELPDAIVACRDTRIVYAGDATLAPPDLETSEHIDCGGRWITPGLIDCHTHLVHAGDRSHEFELRLRGSSYDEIARASDARGD